MKRKTPSAPSTPFDRCWKHWDRRFAIDSQLFGIPPGVIGHAFAFFLDERSMMRGTVTGVRYDGLPLLEVSVRQFDGFPIDALFPASDAKETGRWTLIRDTLDPKHRHCEGFLSFII